MENSLAENIRKYRKAMGLTQEQLAERLDITLGTVSKWERGSSEPDLAYVMDLAELFRVSVDALIGFSMRGADADEEARRIEELSDRITAREPDKRIEAEKIAEEYENALKKFPNHFSIVCGAAETFQCIGVIYKKESEIRRALELYRHAIDLISQNKDPKINETLLRNEIASCYSALKDYKKAVEEYKNNNPTGGNDARLGLLYTLYEKKPDEGIEYTEKAVVNDISNMITAMSGYMAYYISTARYEQGLRAAEQMIKFLESLKEDPDRRAFTDKIICLVYLDLAVIQDRMGLIEASEESLRRAVSVAADFDRDPVFTLENLILLDRAKKTSVYDDTGPTAIEGLGNSLDEISAFVPEGFREKLAARLKKRNGADHALAIFDCR